MTAKVVNKDEKKKLTKVPRRWVAEYIEDDIVIIASPGQIWSFVLIQG